MVPLCQPSLEAFLAQSLNDESFGKAIPANIKISPTRGFIKRTVAGVKESVSDGFLSSLTFPSSQAAVKSAEAAAFLRECCAIQTWHS